MFICVCVCIYQSYILSVLYSQSNLDWPQAKAQNDIWMSSRSHFNGSVQLFYNKIVCIFHWSLLFWTREMTSLLNLWRRHVSSWCAVGDFLSLLCTYWRFCFVLRGMHCFWMAFCFPQPAHRCLIHTSCLDEVYSDIKYVSQPLGFTFTLSSMNRN